MLSVGAGSAASRRGFFKALGFYRPMLVLRSVWAAARWDLPDYPSAWLHPCRARFRFARRVIVDRADKKCFYNSIDLIALFDWRLCQTRSRNCAKARESGL